MLDDQLLEAVGVGEFDSWEFAKTLGVGHNEVVGVLKSLQSRESVSLEQVETEVYELTPEGREIVEHGSPEYRFIHQQKYTLEDAAANRLGFSKCMQNKWLVRDGDQFICSVDLSTLRDTVAEKLRQNIGDPTELIKRKLLKRGVRKHYVVRKGVQWTPKRVLKVSTLSKEHLESGSWETTSFVSTNWRSLGIKPRSGYLHPLLLVREEFRKILLGMGFTEMPTNQWVESSFWNFDALFQPQHHPARDAHDTFFIDTPDKSSLQSVPRRYCFMVCKTHEQGGWGSIGYRYRWSLDEAQRNVLRTHTTAVSTRMLYKVANRVGGFRPCKFFSIDRVFRNESLDATHLAEFHQVEGLVADYNLSLGDLMGTIREFFMSCGITNIRFKPAYNPYTEPSMEIFGYHPDLQKWTEIGNSGMFRPEMLRPMGFPEDVRVIAWGLSLERPTMIKYRIKKIKELFGHKINLTATSTSPLPRFHT
jgi:phenylalanyl-tRNA synthetase alpha chain